MPYRQSIRLRSSQSVGGPSREGRQPRRKRLDKSDRFAILTLSGVVVAATGLIVGKPVFVGLITMITMLVYWPLVAGRVSVRSPWGVVAANVTLSVFVRGLFIAFEYPDRDTIQRLFLLGKDADFFFWPSILMLASLALGGYGFAIGASANRPRGGRSKAAALDRTWNTGRLRIAVVVMFIISAAALLLFISTTGGSVTGLTSTKRTLIDGLQPSNEFRSFGYLRSLSGLARLALLSLSAWAFFRPGKLSKQLLLGIAALGLLSIALPFYASARTDVVWVFVEIAVLWTLAGRSLDIRIVAVAGLVVLIVFQIMSASRFNDQISTDTVLTETLPGQSVVLNRNMLGIAKSAHIIQAVGHDLEPKEGRTIVAWMVAPIPREIWPGKPLVQAGPEAGAKVFSSPRAGVPPGFVADLYWNFGTVGTLVLAFVLFLGIGRAYALIDPLRRPTPSKSLLYLATVFTPTWMLLSNGVGQAVFASLTDGLVVAALIYFVSRGEPALRFD